MELVLYGLKNCDTCRKAMKAVKAMGLKVQFQDVRIDGVPQAVLDQALADLGPDKLLNTRSTTWRKLSGSEQQAEPLLLLQTHPTLIKRPLIVSKGQVSVGWSADIEQKLEAITRAD